MSSISLQLREGTRSAHSSAEGHHFQKALGSGTLPRAKYRHYLGQLFLVHGAIERRMKDQPYMGGVVTEEQFQADFLKRDLDALAGSNGEGSADADVQPLSCTQKMLKRIQEVTEKEPVALLGYHYVLLGSKHGGKFIASVTKKSYELEKDGAVYFDPYGQGFQQHWQHFTGGINELSLNETQMQELLGAASEMFTYVQTLGGEILPGSSDN